MLTNGSSHQAFQYMDPQWFDLDFINNISREVLCEMLENSTEIDCHGETMDKVQNPNKLATFNSLRETYRALGMRFRTYIWNGRQIDWPNCGPYAVEKRGDQVIVICKVSGSIRQMEGWGG